MRNNLLFFCILLAAMAVVLVAASAVSSDWRDRIGDVVGYNVLDERVFEGSVESKPYTIEHIVYFPLRTGDSVVQVQVGPKDFIERSNFRIKASDMLTVTGMPVVMNRRDVVLAREIRSTNGLLVVRDPMGLPLWENDRPIQMDPEGQKAFFQLCALVN
jgi:hypothetical protein